MTGHPRATSDAIFGASVHCDGNRGSVNLRSDGGATRTIHTDNHLQSLQHLLAAHPGERPARDQECAVAGERLILAAVLSRTAVVYRPGDSYGRRLVRHEAVMVDPAKLSWIKARTPLELALAQARLRG
jgi:hypothetical protein